MATFVQSAEGVLCVGLLIVVFALAAENLVLSCYRDNDFVCDVADTFVLIFAEVCYFGYILYLTSKVL